MYTDTYIHELKVHVHVQRQCMVVHSVMCIHIHTCTEGTCTCTCTSAMYSSVQCDAYTHAYIHVHVLKVQCSLAIILGLGKRFESSNLCSFAMHSKLNFSLRSFAASPTLMFAHVHLCNLNVWSIMWVCSRKVEAVFLAAFVSMLNPSRNSDRNKTSTHYKAIIQF